MTIATELADRICNLTFGDLPDEAVQLQNALRALISYLARSPGSHLRHHGVRSTADLIDPIHR